MRNQKGFWVLTLALLLACAKGYGATATIPAGSTIAVRILSAIDPEKNYVGETFRATVDAPLRAGGEVVIPRGAEAIGRLVALEQPGRFTGRSLVALELTALNFDGQSISVQTGWHQEVGSSQRKYIAKLAGIGSLLGTVFGAVTGGKKGVLIGAGVGAAGGAAAGAARGQKSVQIPAESLLVFTLQSPILLEGAPQ